MCKVWQCFSWRTMSVLMNTCGRVQYVIEQYGENNKQSIGMYIQLHQASALKPEKLHSKQQNIGGDKVWQIVLYLPNYNCTNIM